MGVKNYSYSMTKENDAVFGMQNHIKWGLSCVTRHQESLHQKGKQSSNQNIHDKR